MKLKESILGQLWSAISLAVGNSSFSSAVSLVISFGTHINCSLSTISSFILQLYNREYGKYNRQYGNCITDRFNDTTPNSKTPLHQEISEDFAFFLYVCIILIGTWLLLYLCNCFFKSHKYHADDGVPKPKRLQMI